MTEYSKANLAIGSSVDKDLRIAMALCSEKSAY